MPEKYSAVAIDGAPVKRGDAKSAKRCDKQTSVSTILKQAQGYGAEEAV
jgi:hypothetical protein